MLPDLAVRPQLNSILGCTLPFGGRSSSGRRETKTLRTTSLGPTQPRPQRQIFTSKISRPVFHIVWETSKLTMRASRACVAASHSRSCPEYSSPIISISNPGNAMPPRSDASQSEIAARCAAYRRLRLAACTIRPCHSRKDAFIFLSCVTNLREIQMEQANGS